MRFAKRTQEVLENKRVGFYECAFSEEPKCHPQVGNFAKRTGAAIISRRMPPPERFLPNEPRSQLFSMEAPAMSAIFRFPRWNRPSVPRTPNEERQYDHR